MEKNMAIIQGGIISIAVAGIFLMAIRLQIVYGILPIISILLSGFD